MTSRSTLRRPRRSLLAAGLFLAWFVSSTFAESVLSGRISNAATGKNLEGARIEVSGRGIVTYSDSEGLYRIDRLNAGPITLSVSYTGLTTEEIPLTVLDSAPTLRDVALTSEIYKLSKFVVSGEREGNALAITMQQRSTGVKNVVSTDAFGSLGANPADLISRVPGVFGDNDGSGIRYVQIRGMGNQLNSITMDGNRMADAASAGSTREFQFTQVNADTIERIEVIKSPTPDMDADSIGGAVNMVSKSAFDRAPGRNISGQVGMIMRTRWNIDDPRPSLSLSYSEVFKGKLGVAINYGYRKHLSPIPATSQNYENKLEDPAYTYQFGTEDYFLMQRRQGGGVKLDYKLSDSSRFYLNMTRNNMLETSFSHYGTYAAAQSVATRDASGNLTGTGGIVPGYTRNVTEWRPLTTTTVTAQTQNPTKDVKAYHGEVGAVHRFGFLDLDYNAFRSHSSTNYPHTESATIIERSVGIRVEKTDTPFFPNVTQISGPSITDINSYTENTYDLRVARGVDQYSGAALNARVHFNEPVPTAIKAGVRVRQQKRDIFDNRYRWNYVGPDGVMGVNPATGRNDDNLAQFVNPDVVRWGQLDRYAKLPWLNYPNGEKWATPYDHIGQNFGTVLATNPAYLKEDVALSTMTSLANLQNFKETISAGYIMGNVDLGPIGIVGGVRVEKTETEAEGARNQITPAEAARRAAFTGPVTDAELIRRNIAQYGGRLHVSGEYQEVFPGLHFKYEPFRNLIARASYSTNIGRPSIGQLVPNTTISDTGRSITTSNPSLLPQKANNFDVGVEYYFRPAGMISVGVFSKEIRQFIYTAGGRVVPEGNDNGFNGEFTGYTLTTQYNGGWAHVRGYELSYSQQFTSLPGIWKGFGAYANYAHNQTEGDYGGTVPTSQVAGFIPSTANVGISYIRQPLTIRVQTSYSGRRLITVAATQARFLYERARTAWDLKTSYEINRHFSFYFDVTNVFSARERAREYEGGREGLNYNTGPQLLTGINARY